MAAGFLVGREALTQGAATIAPGCSAGCLLDHLGDFIQLAHEPAGRPLPIAFDRVDRACEIGEHGHDASRELQQVGPLCAQGATGPVLIPREVERFVAPEVGRQLLPNREHTGPLLFDLRERNGVGEAAMTTQRYRNAFEPCRLRVRLSGAAAAGHPVDRSGLRKPERHACALDLTDAAVVVDDDITRPHEGQERVAAGRGPRSVGSRRVEVRTDVAATGHLEVEVLFRSLAPPPVHGVSASRRFHSDASSQGSQPVSRMEYSNR